MYSFVFKVFCDVFVFLQLFRPLLNISVEFSAEEFETALLTPNDTLAHIHMPLLKVGGAISLTPLSFTHLIFLLSM